MNSHLSSKFPTMLLVGVFIMMGIACSTGEAGSEEGKMSITTSSREARDYYLKGRDLAEKLRNPEAVEFFRKAIEKDPDFALAYLSLSFVQPTAGGFFEAFNKAKSLKDKVSEGERLWIEGTEAAVNGEPMKQQEYFKKLVAAYPKDERCQNINGNYYFGQQQYDLAIEHYEKAIGINPDFSPPYNQLGYAYRFMEKYDDAEKTFRKYIELIPDDPNPVDSYAELLLKVGKYDASIDNYRKALEINPQFLNPYLGLASNYNLKGDHAAARKELQKMYQVAPDDGWRRNALFAMTVSYVDEGDPRNALETQEKMFALAEKNNDAAAMAGDLNTMGNILLEFGKAEEALKKFNRSLEVMQGSTLEQEQKDLAKQGHLFNTARVALAGKDLASAKADARKYRQQAEARQNRFQLWNVHQLAGMIALEEKRHDQAVEELKQSNLQNPYNLYRLGLAYKGKGNQEKARELFEKAATYNALNNLNYAYIRNKARDNITM